MDEKELQLRVCNYLKDKIKYIENNYSYESNACAHNLNDIYRLIKGSIFIKQDLLVINDILMLIPRGRNSKLKFIYTDELLNFDIEVIVVKLVAEILLYHTGVLILKENKIESYLYIYLINLLILEINQKENCYVSITSSIYKTLNKSYPEIIEKYGLNISNEKKIYYVNFSFNNFKNYISSLFIFKETTFLNGSVAEYDVLLTRLSKHSGIQILHKTLYSSNSFGIAGFKLDTGFKLDIDFNKYELLLEYYLNEQASKGKLKTVFFNSNHDFITDKKEIKN